MPLTDTRIRNVKPTEKAFKLEFFHQSPQLMKKLSFPYQSGRSVRQFGLSNGSSRFCPTYCNAMGFYSRGRKRNDQGR